MERSEETATLGILELLKFREKYYSTCVYLEMYHTLDKKLNLKHVMTVYKKNVINAIQAIDRENGKTVLWKGNITLTDMLTISEFFSQLVDSLTRLGNTMPGEKVPNFKDSLSLHTAKEGLSIKEIVEKMDEGRKLIYDNILRSFQEDIESILNDVEYDTSKTMEQLKHNLGDKKVWKNISLNRMLKLPEFYIYCIYFLGVIEDETFYGVENGKNVISIANEVESIQNVSEKLANVGNLRQVSMRPKSATRVLSPNMLPKDTLLSLEKFRPKHTPQRSKSAPPLRSTLRLKPFGGTRRKRRNRSSRKFSA
jgi:hypothetical protein